MESPAEVLGLVGPTATMPGKPTEAWLEMSGTALPYTATNNSAMELSYQQTLPGTDLTLILPGARRPLPAMLTGRGGPDDESNEQENDDGLFRGDYYWEVPSGISSATLRVHLPSHLVVQTDNYSLLSRTNVVVPVERSVPPVHVAFAPVWLPPPLPEDQPAGLGTQAGRQRYGRQSSHWGQGAINLADLGPRDCVVGPSARPRPWVHVPPPPTP